jgi:anti-sigma regulatory factor (Ser/Thr protein kinase)
MAFVHEACLYAGEAEFLDATVPFVRDGVRAGEPVLVAVDGARIDSMRAALGADAQQVRFEDMAALGANPARIIPAWRAFVAAREPGAPVRGIGEPVWPGRAADELVECHRHEALLNLAFADTESFRLLCPYDTSTLEADVVEEARCSHPAVVEGGVRDESRTWRGLDHVAAPFAHPLPEPPHGTEPLAFGADDLSIVRRRVLAFAAAAGMDDQRGNDLVLAVNELAANSVRHGGGRGTLRLWLERDAIVCEVSDAGRILGPLLGRQAPEPGQIGGYGLWLANQLCDLVQIRCFVQGSAVRARLGIA